jgi:chemotaxis protein CheX
MTTSVFAPSEGDLTAVLTEVWTSFLGEEPIVLPPGLVEIGLGERVTALISITGAFDGHVVVEMAADTAVAVAGAFLQTDPAEVAAADVTDAVGELANMVGGFVKSLAPSPSSLSLPVVLRGRDSSATAPGTVPVCRADVLWHEEPVAVTVLALTPTLP